MHREEIIKTLREYYISERINQVDKDFLEYEEDMASEEDLSIMLDKITELKSAPEEEYWPNPYNSIILYLLGLTHTFDFTKERSDTIGGSCADIDIDADARDRYKLINWIVDRWGRENVANIGTFGTFKPKSLMKGYYRVTEKNTNDLNNLLKEIPDPVHGKEPDWEKVLKANPTLAKSEKYEELRKFAGKLEDMVASFGVHAAGLIISHFPVSDIVPVWAKEEKEMQANGKNKKVERWVTQYDMSECEKLGLVKYDFLSIDNLTIIKECLKLLKEKGIELDPWNLPEPDPKTTALLAQGLLCGVFQMETSGSAAKLILDIKPENINELSAISSLNRPGPLQAGFDKLYIENKASGSKPYDMPDQLAEILKDTNYAILYQEQVMKICQVLCGFTSKEADDVRRAMGKKKAEVLNKWKERFLEGIQNHSGLSKSFGEELWITLAGDPDDPNNNGMADYCFNASHSISYSFITYACAYLKANYPTEFFTALMSVRSQSLQPKDWAGKAPIYLSEARTMDVSINGPRINSSNLGFTVVDDQIYFGLNAIRDVGKTAARSIINARKAGKFKDIFNFLERVDKTKVTRRTFQSLVKAGCFDKEGYSRQELLDKTDELYDYWNNKQLYAERVAKIAEYEIESAETEKLIEERDALRQIRRASEYKRNPGEPLTDKQAFRLQELEDMNLRRKARPSDVPDPNKNPPTLERKNKVGITLDQLIEQAEYIGCFIGQHPAHILFPDTQQISSCELAEWVLTAGRVNAIKQIKTKKGADMADRDWETTNVFGLFN